MDMSLYQVVAFLMVYALAIISPGPNFVLVVNSAVGESRHHSLLTALGIATGSFLFALAGLFGLLLIITSRPPVTHVLTYVGGLYLGWLGFAMLFNAFRRRSQALVRSRDRLSLVGAYRRGLLTNLTNPKAWAFYLSLFSLMVTPDFVVWGKLLLAIAMFSISLAWYAAVALMMTAGRTRAKFQALQPYIQGLLGAVLLYLAARLLLSAV